MDTVRAGYALSRPLMALIEKTSFAGAFTSVYVATAPQLERVGGKYFVHCAAVPMGAAVTTETACELWEHTEAVLGGLDAKSASNASEDSS
eukprot:SAG31_NODE_1893_length_6973_cov_5.870963_2_plen_91_part_00